MLRLDHRRHNTAKRFDSERQRRNVEKQNVRLLAAEHAGLNRRTESDDFIRIHRFVRLFAEEFLDHFLDLRNTRRTADEHDLFDVLWLRDRRL